MVDKRYVEKRIISMPGVSRRARIAVVALVGFLLAAGQGPHAQAGDAGTNTRSFHAKLDARLRAQVDENGSTIRQVIVRAKKGRRGQLRAAVRNMGGSMRKDHALIDGFTVRVPEAMLPALAAHPLVESISDDAAVAAGQADDDVLAQSTTEAVASVTCATRWASLAIGTAPASSSRSSTRASRRQPILRGASARSTTLHRAAWPRRLPTRTATARTWRALPAERARPLPRTSTKVLLPV
jgi:hypothetical protein